MRYAVFSTYDNGGSPGGNWIATNSTALAGGIQPSIWTDGNAIASQMSSDKEVLRTLFTHKAYPGKNAVIWSEVWGYYSSTNGHVATALVRINNRTTDPINWPVRFHYTCYGGWSEKASAALNGVSLFDSGGATCASGSSVTDLVLSIPPNRVSTAIFVSTSNAPGGSTRLTYLAFSNNTFDLPAGLELVDDLETATGGWEQ